jgi:hypothetical protein
MVVERNVVAIKSVGLANSITLTSHLNYLGRQSLYSPPLCVVGTNVVHSIVKSRRLPEPEFDFTARKR